MPQQPPAPGAYAPVPVQPSIADRQQVGNAPGLNPFGETLGRSQLGPDVTQDRPGRDPEAVPPGSPRRLAGFLVSQAGEGAYWPLFQGSNRIGRLDAAEGLHVPIDDPTTSSEHAVILASARPGRLKLEDTGSTNGTYVNGAHLPAGSKRELNDGDVVLFGGFEVIVKIV